MQTVQKTKRRLFPYVKYPVPKKNDNIYVGGTFGPGKSLEWKNLPGGKNNNKNIYFCKSK